jgi:hypothetical protein
MSVLRIATFAGILHINETPHRDPSSWYYCSVNEWPGEVFPMYITGAVTLMTSDLPAKLYNRSFTTRDIWLSIESIDFNKQTNHTNLLFKKKT